MSTERRPVVALVVGCTTMFVVTLAGCDTNTGPAVASALPPQGIAFDATPAEPGALVVAPTVTEVDPVVLPPDPSAPSTPSVTAPTAVETTANPAAVPSHDVDARAISFAELAGFEYVVDDPLASLTKKLPKPADTIPESILALSGERVKVDGYLMPTIFESGRVMQFLLTRSYITCCFGDVLNMNEVIDVTIPGKLEVSYFLSGQPVTVTGWLEVGEKKSEFGYVESIYRVVAEQVEERW